MSHPRARTALTDDSRNETSRRLLVAASPRWAEPQAKRDSTHPARSRTLRAEPPDQPESAFKSFCPSGLPKPVQGSQPGPAA